MAKKVLHTGKKSRSRQPDVLAEGRADQGTPSLTLSPPEAQTADTFPIVAVGASAGGLEALEVLFSSMPPEPGLAFVVIQH